MKRVKKLLCLLLSVSMLAGTCGMADVQAAQLTAGAAEVTAEEDQALPEDAAEAEEVPAEVPEDAEVPAETPEEEEAVEPDATEAAEEAAEEETVPETEEVPEALSREELQVLLDEAYDKAEQPKSEETGYQPLQEIYVEEDVLEQLFAMEEPQEEIEQTDRFEGIRSFGSTYAYDRMSYAQKCVYNEIDQRCQYFMNSNANFTNYSSKFSMDTYRIPFYGLTSSQAFEVYTMYQYANPQYYFTANGIVYNSSGMYITCYPAFALGNNRANVTSQFYGRVKGWLDDINRQRGAFHKQKRAYDLLCQNVTYDYSFGTYDQSAFSAVLQGTTVCAGYSKTFTMLCNGAGIETMGVTSNDHAWNLSYLYGQWYDVDATNGDNGSTGDMDFLDVSDAFFDYLTNKYGYSYRRESYWNNKAPKALNIYLPFSDMPERQGWRFEAVNLVYGSGIMNGINGTTRFDPDKNLTRAMFATMIYRLQGSPAASWSPKFPDVPNGNYFSAPIVWANQKGIITGHSNTGLFGTFEDITREDVVTVIYRYACFAGCNTTARNNLSKFPDAGKVSGYAKTPMQWAVATGIITGRSNTGLLDPQGHATRVECAAILQRFIERYMSHKIR